MMPRANPRTFTGRHMFAILAAFFGVVIVVNLVNARYASSTFGGVVVENSYVASQDFNRWLDEAKAEKALGWDAVTTWRPDGRIVVAIKGAPAGAALKAVARHPLGRLPHRALSFDRLGNGQFLSRQALPDGRWDVRLAAAAAGHVWRHEEHLQ
jgi:nitrogen fixation protein FixH